MASRLVAAASAAALVSTLLVATPALAVAANDNFANATVITSLPYSDPVDFTGSTAEIGEPMPACGYGYPVTMSVWYAYTPAADMMLTAQGWNWDDILVVSTGSSLADLTPVLCSGPYTGGAATFLATAGTTYVFQLSTVYEWSQTSANFTLRVTDPPSIDFWWSPGDPSTYDTVTFSPNPTDPAGMYGGTYAWGFGDGATSADSYPSHHYAADGDYTVSVTWTTAYGRTATASHVVSVRTRDVSVVRFDTPRTAVVGQTRTITVGIVSLRYPEAVDIALYKGTTGGWQQFASQQGTVPLRAGNRTTSFSFSYTFSKEDLAAGKISFRVTAGIVNGRDALPTDNELIAPPTVVTRR